MSELTVQERLQPSLLDRLTDNEPHNQKESRDRRVLSLEKLRQCVLRDLGWLLNTGDLHQLQALDEYPEVSRSVVNYGVPDLSGQNLSVADVPRLEQAVRQAIIDFEPRILRQTVRVRAAVNPEEMSHNTLSFEIEGTLWAQPMPLRLFLKTEIDLETGHVDVIEHFGV
jgi:type VI secretion system protein ImpF